MSGHELQTPGRNLGRYRIEYTCSCGGTVIADGHSDVTKQQLLEDHRDEIEAAAIRPDLEEINEAIHRKNRTLIVEVEALRIEVRELQAALDIEKRAVEIAVAELGRTRASHAAMERVFIPVRDDRDDARAERDDLRRDVEFWKGLAQASQAGDLEIKSPSESYEKLIKEFVAGSVSPNRARDLLGMRDPAYIAGQVTTLTMTCRQGLPIGEHTLDTIQSMGRSQKSIAEAMGISAKHLNQVIKGHVNLSAPLALRFEAVTGFPAQMLMRLQADWLVFEARKATP